MCNWALILIVLLITKGISSQLATNIPFGNFGFNNYSPFFGGQPGQVQQQNPLFSMNPYQSQSGGNPFFNIFNNNPNQHHQQSLQNPYQQQPVDNNNLNIQPQSQWNGPLLGQQPGFSQPTNNKFNSNAYGWPFGLGGGVNPYNQFGNNYNNNPGAPNSWPIGGYSPFQQFQNPAETPKNHQTESPKNTVGQVNPWNYFQNSNPYWIQPATGQGQIPQPSSSQSPELEVLQENQNDKHHPSIINPVKPPTPQRIENVENPEPSELEILHENQNDKHHPSLISPVKLPQPQIMGNVENPGNRPESSELEILHENQNDKHHPSLSNVQNDPDNTEMKNPDNPITVPDSTAELEVLHENQNDKHHPSLSTMEDEETSKSSSVLDEQSGVEEEEESDEDISKLFDVRISSPATTGSENNNHFDSDDRLIFQ